MEDLSTNSNNIINNLMFLDYAHNKKMFKNMLRPRNENIVIHNKTAKDFFKNTYDMNSWHFRDKEFIPNQPSDVLAIGCSNTYGLGLPEDYIWPSIIKQQSNLSVSNLGIIGGSAAEIFNSTMYYLTKIGKPKYILACMPDIFRYHHVLDAQFFSNYLDHKDAYLGTINLNTADFFTGELLIKDKIIKLPANSKYMISSLQSLYQFVSSIYVLESICSLLDIKFYWMTWHKLAAEIFEKHLFSSNYFSLNVDNYIFIKHDKETQNVFDGSTCAIHEKYFNALNNENKEMWDVAADNIHFGIHWQQTTAEMFLNKIK